MSRIAIDPALRGRVTPAVLERMAAAGMRVHRVGQAAHLHDGRHRWLVVITPAPALEARVAEHHHYMIGRGPTPALERRREVAWLARRAHLRLRAPNGRFAERVPWWATVDSVGRLLTPRAEQPWRLS